MKAENPMNEPIVKTDSKIDESLRLRGCFALLSCLGGLVLASADNAETIPLIAVFFAVFGFLFVDWLRLFALPPIIAYLTMGIAAVYCVTDFWSVKAPGQQQMMSVAQLLVFVQAILMLQEKSTRIYEQISVFCLLQLVVAAVFNDAISFGFLLVIIVFIAAIAWALLCCLTVFESIESVSGKPIDLEPSGRDTGIHIQSHRSVISIGVAASKMPRYALWTIAPAIALVAAVFFYALPRRTDASSIPRSGKVLTGFSESMRLDQIGQMMQQTDPALRIKLTDRRGGAPYRLAGGVYLRGQVLENYYPEVDRRKPFATWSAIRRTHAPLGYRLRKEFVPERRSDENFFDSVLVNVSCEPMLTPALFAIAPFYRAGDDSELAFGLGRWTLTRRERPADQYQRIEYEFTTHAFREGVQADLISVAGAERWFGLDWQSRFSDLQELNRPVDRNGQTYLQKITAIDASAMPTVVRLAAEIRDSVPLEFRNDYRIAQALQRYLASDVAYEYTLNLNADVQPGTDPIEQFVADHRRGHCQYFSSALAMMLRSLGIPARIVVGYRTDEYNEIGQYYLARQSDAHAWVEALMDKDQLDENVMVYGQPQGRKYWLRLDPTPGGGGRPSNNRPIDQVLDLANNMWQELVVDMDGRRQNQALGVGDRTESAASSSGLVGWLQMKMARIRAGDLGGGRFAIGNSALIAVGFLVIAIVIASIVLVKLLTRRLGRLKFSRNPAEPNDKVMSGFYSDALKDLARIGWIRQPCETPNEFAKTIRQSKHVDTAVSDCFWQITQAFRAVRYGKIQKPSNIETSLNELRTQIQKQIDTGAVIGRPKSATNPASEPAS